MYKGHVKMSNFMKILLHLTVCLSLFICKNEHVEFSTIDAKLYCMYERGLTKAIMDLFVKVLVAKLKPKS